MQLKLDVEKYDELQEILLREIMEQIRFQLIKGGVVGEDLRELTGEIAFSVASTIDDTAGIEMDGTEVKPYLCFASGEEELLHCGENSCMHELVAGMMDNLFSQ